MFPPQCPVGGISRSALGTAGNGECRDGHALCAARIVAPAIARISRTVTCRRTESHARTYVIVSIIFCSPHSRPRLGPRARGVAGDARIFFQQLVQQFVEFREAAVHAYLSLGGEFISARRDTATGEP